MSQLERARLWIEEHRDYGWDALRVYLGVALFIKGFVYLEHVDALRAVMMQAQMPFASSGIARLVAVAHVAGGLLLTFGLWTRIAALVQMPIVAGAVFFVHWQEGLFTAAQTLEFSVMVLFILGLIAVGGAGRLSTDYYFRAHTRHEIEAEAQHA